MFLKNNQDVVTIIQPENSLLVFNTNKNLSQFPDGSGYYYNAGTKNAASWIKLFDKNNDINKAWLLQGNAAIDEAKNFIGTTDNKNVVLKRGNIETLKLTAGGALLATGDILTGKTPFAGAGQRLMWVPKSMAFRAGFVSASQWDDENIGIGSFATGIDNTASGKSSFAAGEKATAQGDFSISIGNSTEATGNFSIALGKLSVASADGGVAIGVGSRAERPGATAIGYANAAKADFSTALGAATQAMGFYATSLGVNTVARGNSSLATGNKTVASGESSTTFGIETNAQGKASVAFGNKTQAVGDYSTAMGSTTSANGPYSFATGNMNVAEGPYTVAIGLSTKAEKNASVAMGFGTKAIGETSLSMGVGTIAKGNYSTAIGFQTRANTYSSFSIGMFNDNIDNNINPDAKNDFIRLFQIGNGNSEEQRKNVMTVLKNGNIGINTSNPHSSLHIMSNIADNNRNSWNTYIQLEEKSSNASAYIRYSPIGNSRGLQFKPAVI